MSLSNKSEEIEKFLASIDEAEVYEAMKRVAAGLGKDYGVVLFFFDGCAGVLCGGKGGNLRRIFIVREKNMFYAKVSEEVLEQKCKVIIAASMAKLFDENEKVWWVSKSGCKMRAAGMMKHIGDKTLNINYVPCIYQVTPEGIKSNIRKAFIKEEVKVKVEEDKKILKEIFNIPITDRTITKKIVYATEVKDLKVQEKLNKMKKYILTEMKENEDRRRIFMKVMERIARIGEPDMECLQMMQTINEEGDKERRALYRIGAFLPNGGIFLEFTRYKNTSYDIGWFPLSYDTNSTDDCVLLPIKNGKENVVAELLHLPRNLKGLQPKVYCILKDRNGKRIVNGCIYFIEEIRKKLDKDINKDAELSIVPQMLEEYVERKIVDEVDKSQNVKIKENNNNINNKEIIKKKKKGNNLPIITMTESDKWIELSKKYRGTDDEMNNNNNNNLENNENLNCENNIENEEILCENENNSITQNNNNEINDSNDKDRTNVNNHNDENVINIETVSSCENEKQLVKCGKENETCAETVLARHESHVSPEDEAEPLQSERQSSRQEVDVQELNSLHTNCENQNSEHENIEIHDSLKNDEEVINIQCTDEDNNINNNINVENDGNNIEINNIENNINNNNIEEDINNNIEIEVTNGEIDIIPNMNDNLNIQNNKDNNVDDNNRNYNYNNYISENRKEDHTSLNNNTIMETINNVETDSNGNDIEEVENNINFQIEDISKKCMLIVKTEKTNTLNIIVRIEKSILEGRDVKVDIVVNEGEKNIFKKYNKNFNNNISNNNNNNEVVKENRNINKIVNDKKNKKKL